MHSLSRIARSLTAALAPAALCLTVLTAGAPPAAAQQIVARVNGEPITAVDLSQRTRLNQVSGSKVVGRNEVLNELIDEQLKLQTAARYRMTITEAEVDQVIANMAGRMRASPDQFAKALAGSGLSINALKRKVRADIAWNQIIRGKFQAALQVREKDVFLAAREQSKETVGYDYTLRPILLVVPRGAGGGAMESRRREAEGLRSRFQNCEDGLRLARGLRDVAIREQMVRSSADLPPKLREVLDGMSIGRLTPPEVTPTGIEVFALCARTETKGSLSGAQRDVRERMFSERFEAEGRRYLRELRRSAAIETR
jgi:peptidyl-prolyl cis-trans isomerase SurA